MSPNVTSKRGGPKKGQRCSNPKIPKVLAELGVQGFGCLEPSRSTPGTLQDAYNLDPTRPTSKKPTLSVNIPSQPHIAPRRRDDRKNKSRSAQRNAGRAPRKAARTSASASLKPSLHSRGSGTEDDTKIAVPDDVYPQPRVLKAPAPAGDSTYLPLGHLSSQPGPLRLAESRSSQTENHTVHHPPPLGTPSPKTASLSHARMVESIQEPTPNMGVGTVAGGVVRNERTRYRSSPYALLDIPPTTDTDRASTVCLTPAAFHLPFANRSAPLYDSAFLEALHALDDRGRPHAARNCTAPEAAFNAADNDHCRPLTQTSSLGDSKEYPCDALAVNSLVPYPHANAKSKLSTFSTLAQALGSPTPEK
ncbi:hypothetical protein PYCCODRAFT_58555 [Trametes coccinea BRFM310]|uniref:Uncharacterized protein n=1 Tax=Trametes coccinea (strain BRFM310) TaxID=1353009 RepID=A0A1Y2IU67_TRAC3|nr:hypothetical protein PYCCODRAFT_58555 [Trametes coccinea BRFM310]